MSVLPDPAPVTIAVLPRTEKGAGVESWISFSIGPLASGAGAVMFSRSVFSDD